MMSVLDIKEWTKGVENVSIENTNLSTRDYKDIPVLRTFLDK